MARYFDGSDAMQGGTQITDEPLTIACWFRAENITGTHGLVCVGDLPNTNGGWGLEAAGNVAGDPLRCYSIQGVSQRVADTSTSFSANTWHHACGVFSADDARAVYLDGGGKGTGSDSRTVGTPVSTEIGYVEFFGGILGKVAHVAVWNVALNDAEVALLAKRVSPLIVRPNALVNYWPLTRMDLDVMAGDDLSNYYGTSSFTDGINIARPAPPLMEYAKLSPGDYVQLTLNSRSTALTLESR